MIKKKSIAKNAVLNSIRTVLSIMFPLITYPYISRVLHANNLGRVTYAQSIVSYFSLIAALGINTYAVREGAKLRKDHHKLNTFCSEIFTTNIITTILSYVLLAICIKTFPNLKEYRSLIFIFSISITFTTIGVEWVNVIFEDYWIITIRSIAVQLLNILLLFLLIKTTDDFIRYACLIVFTNGIVGILNYIYCKKYVNLKITLMPNLSKHIKPLLIFFSNNLAISIYCYADTTMIGWMINDKSVGIYSIAVKAYTVIKTLLASIYTVCIPRLSLYYANSESNKYSELVNDILCCLILLLFPTAVGISVLSEPIVLFLGGSEYIDAACTLRILSVSLVFAILGGVFSNCINIPTGKEKVTLIGTILAAIINIILNILFIPLFGQAGAAITTVIAEASVVLVCYISNKDIRSIIIWKKVIINSVHAILGCFVIVLGYFISKCIKCNMIQTCCVTIIFSFVFYQILLCILKNKYYFKIINKIYELLAKFYDKKDRMR